MALGILTAFSKNSRTFSELRMKSQILKWFRIRNEIFSFFGLSEIFSCIFTLWTLCTFRREIDSILFYINITTLLTLINNKILVNRSYHFIDFFHILST